MTWVFVEEGRGGEYGGDLWTREEVAKMGEMFGGEMRKGGD